MNRATQREYRQLAASVAEREALALAAGKPKPTRAAAAAALEVTPRTLTRALAWCRTNPAPASVTEAVDAQESIERLDAVEASLVARLDRLADVERPGAAHEEVAAVNALLRVQEARRLAMATLRGAEDRAASAVVMARSLRLSPAAA